VILGHQSSVEINGVLSAQLHNVISTQLRRSDSLQVKVGNEGKARWSKADSYILVCKYVSHVCF
jgi:hypothetical protein